MEIKEFKWQITPSIEKLLKEVDILKIIFEKLPLPESVLQIVRKRSFINSAVYSAQIENIPSTVQAPRREGKNLELAYHWVYSFIKPEPITVEIIKNLHKKTLDGLSGSAGQFRMEPWGIYNQAGILIQHTPLHTAVPSLVEELANYSNGLSGHPTLIAAITQFIFEKIHPFADGNGRAGRLISAYILQTKGYGFKGLVPLEMYINKHRDVYYSVLEPARNCTDFIEFFLEALIAQANQTLEELQNPPLDTPKNNLLPRRRELLEVVTDHPECSFDFLRRRFMNLSPISLHRDLKHLQELGLVDKLGSTRGAVYVAKS